VGKPEVKRLLGRPSRRWEYNIKMDFKVILWGGGGDLDWIVVVEGRNKWWVLVNMVMNFQVP